MRILDIQRRLREVGRIRIGQQVPTSNGKTRPSKLSTFRLTARDQHVIDAAAAQWGGTVTPWDDAPGGKQWQVTTETSTIPVVVPPGEMSFSQAYEVWSAGGCKVRCDGQWDHVSDKACHCDPEARACDIHTRLSVILPDLPGLGVWRLDTQGYYAAVELGGTADICASAAGRGVMLPARLMLEQRSVKRIADGKVVTRNYAVPVLDVDVHPLALTGAASPELAPPPTRALTTGNLTPVPQVDGALAPTFAEQVAAVEAPSSAPPRANAAQPIPPTGVRPRTAREAADGDPRPIDVPSDDGGGEEPPPADRDAAVSVSDVARYATTVFKADYDAAPRGDKTKVVERLRHAMAYAVSGRRTASFKDLEPDELIRVRQRLKNIADGDMTYATDTEGVTFVLMATGRETSVLWADLEQTEAA